MRGPKCRLSFSKEKKIALINAPTKNRDSIAYKSSKAECRLIHPSRVPSYTGKQLPLLAIPQRLQSRLG